MDKSTGAESASRPSSTENPSPGPGVRSLFRGHPPSSPRRHSRIPRWYLLGADLILMAAALVVMYRGPAPLSGNETLFGVAAVVLGAGLALIAICMRDPTDT
jgi:hypothetical protein